MNKVRLMILLVILIVLAAIYTLFTSPQSTQSFSKEINPGRDPVQKKVSGLNKIPFVKDDLILMLNPIAEYDIAARVLDSKRYYSDWNSPLSPVDLALGWQKMSVKENLKKIKISQGSRFYYYKYQTDSVLRKSYISRNSANCHMIPANENIEKAVKKVTKNDIVRIKGWLVNVSGTYKKNRKVHWNTSLTRNDTGNGACEIIYVKSIRVNNKLYE